MGPFRRARGGGNVRKLREALVPTSCYPLVLQLFKAIRHVLVPARLIDGWSFELICELTVNPIF